MADAAVVLLSGGLASCVAATLTRAIGMDLALLHGSWGQASEARERRAFEAIADHLRVPPERRLAVDLPVLRELRRRGPEPLPLGSLLAAATAWGDQLQARAVVAGCSEAAAGRGPDRRESFLRAFEVVAALGTRPGTRLPFHAPLLRLSGAEAVRRGTDLGAPLHLTWSCEAAGGPACGACAPCRDRSRAFREAGIDDPVADAHLPEAPGA